MYSVDQCTKCGHRYKLCGTILSSKKESFIARMIRGVKGESLKMSRITHLTVCIGGVCKNCGKKYKHHKKCKNKH